MKVIIDLIEDIRTAINNERSFSLSAMGLQEGENSEFTPIWQSELSAYTIDTEAKKLFLYLGKDKGIEVGEFLDRLSELANEEMMYELCVSYTKGEERIDSPLMGFGESFIDKKYLLFVNASKG